MRRRPGAPRPIASAPAWLLALLSVPLAACGASAGPARHDPPAPPSSAAAVSAPPVLASGGAAVELVWQSDGGAERLREPAGLAVDRRGAVYIADAGRDRIVSLDGRTGRAATGIGGPGAAVGQFRFAPPAGADRDERGRPLAGQLAVDADGRLHVADSHNRRLQVLDRDGHPRAMWAIPGAAAGQAVEPGGLAIDAEGHLYVADRWSHRIRKLDRDGAPLLAWGGPGPGNGEFSLPLAVAVDGQRAGLRAGRGQRPRPGLRRRRAGSAPPGARSAPTPASSPARPGWRSTPTVGSTWRTAATHRVQVFTDAGVFLGAWGSLGVGPGQFAAISGIAVDEQGAIYVADSALGRVQKFRRRAPWPAVAGTPTPRPAPPTPAPSTGPPPPMTPTDR